MATTIKKFRNNILEHQLLTFGDRVFVAVSGGPDSMALLHLFLQVQSELNLTLAIIHYNHKLRNEDSDNDEAFVRRLADKLKVEVLVEAGDVRDFAVRNKVSLETAARELRYSFFTRVLAHAPDSKIATGHHANDQAETLLDRLLRGTGLAGMAGIPWQRDRFIRPLLDLTHGELIDYLASNGIEYRLDSSNEDLYFRRNRIRHLLLPLLKREFNPSIIEVLNRNAEIFAEANIFLNFFAQNSYKECLALEEENKIILDIFKFLNYFTVVQKYIVFQVLTKFAILPEEIGTKKINAIIQLAQDQKQQKFIIIKENCRFGIWQNQMVFANPERPSWRVEIDITNPIHELPGNKVLRITNLLQQEVYNSDVNIELVDADQLARKLLIRTIEPGDRFHPINMKGSKKLSDFLIDEKVPYYRRPELLVLESNQQIVWICGMRLDDRFKITPETKHIIKLEYLQAGQLRLN